MIERLGFGNLKNLVDVDIVGLSPLSLFVGPNGSGKTTILQGVSFLSESLGRGPEEVFKHNFALDKLVNRKKQEAPIMLGCYTDEAMVRIDLFKRGTMLNGNQIGTSNWMINVDIEAASQGEPGTGESQVLEIQRDFGASLFLSLKASVLSKPAYSSELVPSLSGSGANLGTVLAFMALNHRDRFETLLGYLQRIVPSFRDLKFIRKPLYRRETELIRFGNEGVKRETNRKYVGTALLLDFDHVQGIEASGCSEGTLLALGLLTAVLQPAAPKRLLIDDLEHGFHPLAQKAILDILRDIGKGVPKVQIFATTHSPYLLNAATPDEVWMVGIGQDGETKIGQLTQHVDYRRWSDEMHPGEMWGMFGEGWIVSTSPSEWTRRVNK